MTRKVLITSALPYANGPLHFGHIAGAYLPADCYARYERLKGSRVLYICGSDEYGIAITLSAEMAKRSPKEHVDSFHQLNQQLFKQLNFSFDHFSRTTWEGHIETTQQFFLDLLKAGHIEEQVTDQLYSESEGKFLADRYVVGTCPKCGFEEARGDECPRCAASYEATDLIQPRSKISKTLLIKKPTKHWFLRFDHFKERLSQWISEKRWKPNVTNFAKGYIDQLKPRAITRDMQWGVPLPLPNTEGKVLYVWFDAPIGYISATKEWAQQHHTPDAWKDFWLDPKTRLVQFIGKDNIPFHAVFFPAMVMGQSQPYKLVDELPANEFYNLEGRQFSKSDGWYIDLERFFKKFSADQIRYVIAANAPESQDAEFSWKDFQGRCNSELVGKFGNFVNRTLTFLQAQCEGQVPALTPLHPIDQEFLDKVKGLVRLADEAYAQFQLRRASQIAMELAQLGNVYFDAKKPWIAARSALTHRDMQTTLACCLECIKCLALIASPIIPEAADQIGQWLGLKEPLHTCRWDDVFLTPLQEGIHLPVPKILFNKVEDAMVQDEIDQLQKKEAPAPISSLPPLKEQIAIDEVRRLDLRVAKVIAVERVPKSKKLLKLTVDLGFEQRTVVAGIGEKIEDITSLIGREIVIVANLKPAMLMGIESQGMILAADSPTGLQLPLLPNTPPGTPLS